MFQKKQLHSFADVIRGLQDAVCSAHDALLSHRLRSLERFWNGTAPLSKKVSVGGLETDVPLLSVLPQTHIEIEDVEVAFNARIEDVSQIMERDITGADETHSNLMVSLDDVKQNDPHTMQVRIRFKCRQPEEGLQRLTDQYDKLI